MTNTQETVLIDSIKKQAHDEAQKVLDSAQRFVEERKKSTDDQIIRLKKENEEKEKQQVNAIAQDAARKIASLERKQLLIRKEKMVQHVIERVQEKFAALLAQPEFKEILLDWTVEAALGLEESDPSLNVSASCAHLVDDAFLDKAAHLYKKLTGEDITFTRAPEVMPKGCGIILEAKNGRTAYNNLLENRLHRYDDTIQAIVLEDIFNE
ncbi:hypothetical protein JXA02_03230 [candidate division KSB1 bacterium]|nr:hypothetical protein [candidate division KSB1 bacterium]RQW09644.1 MAG: hypothetical protein EH222_03605 [candidate division KSB1 bacterium]